MGEFEFNAPQHKFDLNVGLDDSDGADTFFDVESEEPVIKMDEDKENTPQDVFMSPSSDNEAKGNLVRSLKKIATDSSTNVKRRSALKAVRRLSSVIKEETSSLSMAERLSKDLSDKLTMKMTKRTFDGIEIDVKPGKPHTMTTRSDQASKTPTIALRTRTVNKEDGPNRKRKAEVFNHEGTKYMAMAERILHFQKDTPPRFHTKKRNSIGGNQDKRLSLWNARKSYNPRRTIALTPKLMTTLRTRSLHVISQEEKEEQELEEMKKFQVKANPLNKNIFKEPKPLQKSAKPKTIQEPFKLTRTFKKLATPKTEEPYHFTANPVPKVILKRTIGLKPKPEIPVTVPQSPAITKPKRVKVIPTVTKYGEEGMEDLSNFGVPYSKENMVKSTVVKPFSFEERDRQLMEKKQKKIQEILEAERKAREFKANPKPKFQPPKETNRCSRMDLTVSSIPSSRFSEDRDIFVPFKARSPRVLRKPAFHPVVEHIHSEPLNVQLRTDLRAKEREEFETKQMEKEERLAYLREQMEAEKKKKEEEEIAKLRREIVHKAQPMPKYPPSKNKVSSSIPLTEPKSPRFTTKRTRMNTSCTLTSSDNIPTSTTGN